MTELGRRGHLPAPALRYKGKLSLHIQVCELNYHCTFCQCTLSSFFSACFYASVSLPPPGSSPRIIVVSLPMHHNNDKQQRSAGVTINTKGVLKLPHAGISDG